MIKVCHLRTKRCIFDDSFSIKQLITTKRLKPQPESEGIRFSGTPVVSWSMMTSADLQNLTDGLNAH